MTIFKDMDESETLNAKKAIYSEYRTRDNLTTNVAYTVDGLSALMKAVKDANEASKHVANNMHWFEDIKKNHDSIAFLFEEFVKEFKPLYEEINNRYVIEKLASDELKKSYVEEEACVASTEDVPYYHNTRGWKNL